MPYTRTNWINKQTKLSAENLNNIEEGIEESLSKTLSNEEEISKHTAKLNEIDIGNSNRDLRIDDVNSKASESLGKVNSLIEPFSRTVGYNMYDPASLDFTTSTSTILDLNAEGLGMTALSIAKSNEQLLNMTVGKVKALWNDVMNPTYIPYMFTVYQGDGSTSTGSETIFARPLGLVGDIYGLTKSLQNYDAFLLGKINEKGAEIRNLEVKTEQMYGENNQANIQRLYDDELPTNPVKGQIFCLIDSSTGQQVYKQYNGKEWVALSNKEYVDEQINNVVDIAQGKTKSYVLDTTHSYLNSNYETIKPNTILISEEKNISLRRENFPLIHNHSYLEFDDLKVGDVLYIMDENIPDRWVSYNNLMTITLTAIEAKTKLDNYPTKEEMREEFDKGLKNVILPSSITPAPNYIAYHILTNYGEGKYLISRESEPSASIVFTTDNLYANSYQWTLFNLGTNDLYKNIDVVNLDTITSASDLTYEAIISVKNSSETPEDEIIIKQSDKGEYVRIANNDVTLHASEAYIATYDDTIEIDAKYSGEYIWGSKTIYSEGDISEHAEGNLSISSQGVLDIISDNIVLNGKSWDKLYKQVQNLYGISNNFNEATNLSHTIEIPSNASQYAMINKIGGMSYVSENLIISDDKEETTVAGVTFTFKDGIYTLNGTATTSKQLLIPLKKPIIPGTYTLKNFIDNNQTTISKDTIAIAKENRWETIMHFAPVNQQYVTKTTTETGYYLMYYVNAGNVYNNYKLKPMLVRGSIEPNTFSKGFENIRNSVVTSITMKGANLFNLPDETMDTSKACGFSISCNKGKMYFSGQSTSTGNIVLDFSSPLPAGTYTLNLFNVSVNDMTKKVIFGFKNRDSAAYHYNTIDKVNDYFTFTSETEVIAIFLGISEIGIDLTNLTLYPMVTTGSIPADEFKNYVIKHTDLSKVISDLTDYGCGVEETNINYIDFENQKYIRHCAPFYCDGTKGEIYLSAQNDTTGFYRYHIGNNTNKFLTTKASNTINNNLVQDSDIPNYTTWGDYSGQKYEQIAIQGYALIVIIDKNKASTVAEMKAWLAANPISGVYTFDVPIERDISNELDNIIEVEANGTITFENEYGYDIPSTVTFYEKEEV